jgi:nucleotide-binding universal stress UspA family protein
VSTQPKTVSKVVIALDPADPSDFALEIARHLLGDLPTELLGLFIEDTLLLQHAGSRLAREVVLSGRERPLDPAALERQIRAQSAQVRACFERAAARLGLPHAFQVRRGEIVPELARQAAEAEALIVGLGKEAFGPRAWGGAAIQQLAGAPLRLLLFAREGWLAGSGILAVIEDVARATAILENAALLASHSGSPLTLLLTGEAANEGERLVARLSAAVQARGRPELRGEVMTAPSFGAEPILQAARSRNARLLVLPARRSPRDVELVVELLRKIRSAVMLVGDREPQP